MKHTAGAATASEALEGMALALGGPVNAPGATCAGGPLAARAGLEPVVAPPPPSPVPGTAAARGWPVGDYLAFAPFPQAVPCARLHARQLAWEWGLAPPVQQAAEQVVAELVGNAVTAAAAAPGACPAGVWLMTDHRALLVLVWDASPRLPRLQEAGAFSERGRGLFLVAHFSTAWRWSSFCTNLDLWTRHRQMGEEAAQGGCVRAAE